MANVTYTVVSGDTLTSIARKYDTTVDALVKLNNIKDKNLIHVGQVLIVSGTQTTAVTNSTSNQVKITKFGLLSGSYNTVYVEWEWDKPNTKEYEVKWYRSWDNQGIALSEEYTTNKKYHTYTAPSEVVESPSGHVSVTIRPISETKDNVAHWTASWSTISEKTKYYFSNNAPSDNPSAPSVRIEDYTLTAELDNIPDGITKVEFEVVKNNSSSTFARGTSKVTSNYASFSCTVDSGSTYKARCRYINDNGTSEWSSWSSDGDGGTKPAAPSGITVCRAESETSVYLEWNAVENADSYDIEYADKLEYLNGSDQTRINSTTYTQYIKTGLESGKEYFFRVRAVNGKGESAWTSIKSVIIGTTPIPPTTWSSTTTVVTGEPLTLYWVHNSEDNSAQTKAEVELTINGVTTTYTVDTASEDEDEKTMHYSIDTSGYVEGVTILWRVRTAGATKTLGEWSIQRTVTVYAPPTLSINVTNLTGNETMRLTSFPFSVKCVAGPNTQVPTGYHITIISNSYYETIDNVGIRKVVNAGDAVYSEYINETLYGLTVDFSANNVDLENNITYTVIGMVSMNSGLTAEDSREFTVSWTDESYDPNAEIGINQDDITAVIRPYCKDEDGNLLENVTLSVYRREFDGGFTELITGLDNTKGTFITDPHPALDYARYRIVAIAKSTGAVSYYDIAGYPVGEKAVVIQWNEDWSNFEPVDNHMIEHNWTGSMLKLPYNIDISDDHQTDVSIVEYIGRKHPVSYYGTQLGQTSTWNMVIPKNDKETLYALRRLAIWMGDVYVREPSGSGYWANVSVSFSQKHLETTIPVKLSITRVAGGA